MKTRLASLGTRHKLTEGYQKEVSASLVQGDAYKVAFDHLAAARTLKDQAAADWGKTGASITTSVKDAVERGDRSGHKVRGNFQGSSRHQQMGRDRQRPEPGR